MGNRGYLLYRRSICYLGNHILKESCLQLQPPLLAGAQQPGAIPGFLRGAVGPELQRGRAAGKQRWTGPVTVVTRGQHARPVRLCQQEVIRELAEADEERRYPCQDHKLLLVSPEAPQRWQHTSVDVRQQPGRRALQRGEAVLGRVVLCLRPATRHHGPATKTQQLCANEAPRSATPPPFAHPVLNPLTQRNPRAQANPVSYVQEQEPDKSRVHRITEQRPSCREGPGEAVSGGEGCGEASGEGRTQPGFVFHEYSSYSRIHPCGAPPCQAWGGVRGSYDSVVKTSV